MSHKYLLPLVLAATVLAVAVAVRAADETLHIVKPYVRAVPAGQDQTAAYLVLRNTGARAIALTAVSSPAARAAGLHTTVKENGMMKMRPVSKIEIPPGGETRLEPGGQHIMLIGLKHPLAAGEGVMLVLRFDDGSERRLLAPVRAVTPDTNMPSAHSHRH